MWPPTPTPGRLARLHHDRGVPPDVGADPALDVLVAGEPRLALGRDRVDVVGAAQRGHADLPLPGPLEQLEHQVARPVRPAASTTRVERLEPLAGLGRVDVGELAGQPVADDGQGRRGTHGSPQCSDAGQAMASTGRCSAAICCPRRVSSDAPSLRQRATSGSRSVSAYAAATRRRQAVRVQPVDPADRDHGDARERRPRRPRRPAPCRAGSGSSREPSPVTTRSAPATASGRPVSSKTSSAPGRSVGAEDGEQRRSPPRRRRRRPGVSRRSLPVARRRPGRPTWSGRRPAARRHLPGPAPFCGP